MGPVVLISVEENVFGTICKSILNKKKKQNRVLNELVKSGYLCMDNMTITVFKVVTYSMKRLFSEWFSKYVHGYTKYVHSGIRSMFIVLITHVQL